MRAIDCPSGHHLEATDDAELLRRCREHIAEHHPDMQRTDEQLREHIAEHHPDMQRTDEQLREHIAEHHPDMQRTDEQLRERVAVDAYDANLVA